MELREFFSEDAVKLDLEGGTKEWARSGLPLVVEERAVAA